MTMAGVVQSAACGTGLSTNADRSLLQVNATGYLCVSSTATEYAEDSAHADAQLGTLLLARRIDAAASSTATSGDYGTLNMDANGRLWTNADISYIAGTAPGATNPLPVRLTDGASFVTPSTVDTEDDAVAAGQSSVSLTISQLYVHDGTDWSRAATNDGAVSAQTLAMAVRGAALTALQLIDDDQTGASVHYRTSAGATEDEHEIKATAGRLFSISTTNTNAAVRYLRCYNLTAANTTPGTSTVFLGLAIPGATTGAGFTADFGPAGIAFGTALTCALTTGAADSDVAEVAANEIKVVYAYK
jgi:hypothetical protein